MNHLNNKSESPEIPELTEVFDGSLENAIMLGDSESVASALPILEDEVSSSDIENKNSKNEDSSAESLEELLIEMMPRIKLEVKKQILQEMIEIEKVLTKKIEQKVIKTIMKEIKGKT